MTFTVPAKFYFGSPIENKPKLPEGFRFIEYKDSFLLATDGKDEYYVSKDELVLRHPVYHHLVKNRTIRLAPSPDTLIQ